MDYEQYYGDGVSLLSGDDRYKDPHALTVGVIYHPVPLVSLDIDHRMGQGGHADNSANLTFTYRLGEAFAKQLSGDSALSSHLLANMRNDLVSRNNQIVLDQHKKDVAQLRLPATLSGDEGQTLQFALEGAASVQALSWSGSAAGFVSSYDGSGQVTLTLPEYVDGAANSNTYSLQATAIDGAGRSVTSNVMVVTVASLGLSLTAHPYTIQADGMTTSTLYSVIKDTDGNDVGPGVPVTWSASAGTLSNETSITDEKSMASVVLTSSTAAGTTKVEASTRMSKRSVIVTFKGGAPASSSNSASPSSIVADGQSTSTIRVVIKDTHGNLVGAGVVVNWTHTGSGTLDKASSSTDADGVATVTVTSPTTAGSSTITATAGNATSSTTVSFTVGATADVTVTASPASITANGTSTSTLSATVEDAHGNPISDATVSWSTGAGTLASTTSTTNALGVATVLLTSATTAGNTSVTATAGTGSATAIVTFTTPPPAAVTLVASETDLVPNGTSTSALSATVTMANGESVGAGVTVTWTTTAGTLLAASSVTDAQGIARTTLTSARAVASARVTATAGTATGNVTVGFSARLQLSAGPVTGGDYYHSVTVTATLTTDSGVPISGAVVHWGERDGVAADFSASTSTTDSRGEATVTIGSSIWGYLGVTASALTNGPRSSLDIDLD